MLHPTWYNMAELLHRPSTWKYLLLPLLVQWLKFGWCWLMAKFGHFSWNIGKNDVYFSFVHVCVCVCAHFVYCVFGRFPFYSSLSSRYTEASFAVYLPLSLQRKSSYWIRPNDVLIYLNWLCSNSARAVLNLQFVSWISAGLFYSILALRSNHPL